MIVAQKIHKIPEWYIFAVKIFFRIFLEGGGATALPAPSPQLLRLCLNSVNMLS